MSEQVCFRYDGSFFGFLCCVFDAYAHREEPMEFLTQADDRWSLWSEREVLTEETHARRVYTALVKKTSPRFGVLVEQTFLTDLPQREELLYRIIRRALAEGKMVERDLSDPDRAKMLVALRRLATEVDHLKGFARFSQRGELLVGEIEPKCRVLPLLGPHFFARFQGEKLILFDRTHREAYFGGAGRWTIRPVESLELGPASQQELQWQTLWRQFFQSVTIPQRENPRTQRTHLPLRYRGVMTEFQPPEEPGREGLPEGAGPV